MKIWGHGIINYLAFKSSVNWLFKYEAATATIAACDHAESVRKVIMKPLTPQGNGAANLLDAWMETNTAEKQDAIKQTKKLLLKLPKTSYGADFLDCIKVKDADVSHANGETQYEVVGKIADKLLLDALNEKFPTEILLTQIAMEEQRQIELNKTLSGNEGISAKNIIRTLNSAKQEAQLRHNKMIGKGWICLTGKSVEKLASETLGISGTQNNQAAPTNISF